MKRFLIIVEGDADKKFIQDYYHHLFGEEAPENSIIHSGKNSDTGERRAELLAIKEAYGVEFELFLLPNDKDAGALEDLLENIINPDNQPVMNCWQTYEGELAKVRIPTKTPPTLTIPAKKTKIYAYLETLLGKTRSQKELIKDRNRNYETPQHWNLDAEYLESLKRFLVENIMHAE